MADSFHFSVNIISRGKGKSAVASAAYISGEKIKNEWDGVTHDYTRKEKILVKNIILPDHIPKEFNDRSTLWNKVEMAEKNSNAQLARQFIIGLPKELSLSENKNLVERYIKENLTSQGMIVDYAIHDESQDKNGNIHCHIMTIMRPINEKGEFLAKSKKEYILDEKGEKVLNKNGKPKTRKVELTTWNDTGNVEKWRENFSDLCNKYLERAGAEKRVDHRSFKRQNSDYLPTIHLGSAASAMERKGIETDKGNYNREIRKYNQLVKTIKEEIKTLKGWIGNLLDNLSTAYEKFKDIERDKVIDNPLVNKQDSLAMNFLTSLLREIEVISSKTLDFVVITSNEHLIRNLIDRDYYIITKEIPFFIENSKVGNYFKIFVKNGGQFIPIIDCTEFKIQSKKYFEININKFYLKLLDYFLHGEIPEKFKFFGNTSNFNIESLFLEFIDSQENIRVVSLLDCLIQLSSKNIEISGNYKGHTVKKILKKFALYSVITKLDITKVNHLLRNDYIYFLMKEIDNITKKYPKLIQKYPRDILSDRYGITNEVYRYLIGENLHIKINHKLDEVRYFTDIPFIDTSLSIEEFDKIVSKILKIKVGG